MKNDKTKPSPSDFMKALASLDSLQAQLKEQ